MVLIFVGQEIQKTQVFKKEAPAGSQETRVGRSNETVLIVVAAIGGQPRFTVFRNAVCGRFLGGGFVLHTRGRANIKERAGNGKGPISGAQLIQTMNLLQTDSSQIRRNRRRSNRRVLASESHDRMSIRKRLHTCRMVSLQPSNGGIEDR